MTRGQSKKFALAILERWLLRTVWLVKWPVDEAIEEFMWFRSEDRARMFAATLAGATVTAHIFLKGDGPELGDDPRNS